MERALQTLAVRFFKMDLVHSFAEDEVLFALQAMPGRSGGRTPTEILNAILKHTGLLQKVGGEFVFVHRSIWEYFVACGMRDEAPEKLVERANVPTWEEPIRLYVGLSTDVQLNEIIPQLWQRNRGLTLRALCEQQEFPEAILQSIVKDLSQRDRLRLIFDLEESLEHLKEGRQIRRNLFDTAAAIIRYEKDSEVLYRLIGLINKYSTSEMSADGRLIVDRILDPKGARKRRHALIQASKSPLRFVAIRSGTFEMGTDDSTRPENERPRHCVELNSFWISKFPVTNAQYYGVSFPFSSDRRESRSNHDDEPVIFPTWYDAIMFAWWIGCDLPTEAEWEYTCRGGGLDDSVLFDEEQMPRFAWFAGNSENRTHLVGLKAPNSFGLHDMLGNVREWCRDWHSDTYYSECAMQGCVLNPQGPESGTMKVLRGGGFDWNLKNLLPIYRNYNLPGNSYFCNGFRLVFRNVDPLE